MQGAPKETPKRRQMLAFTKVGDLLSKPSKTMGVVISINLSLVEHSVVCKISFIKCVAFSGLLRKGILGVPIEATESEATSSFFKQVG